MKNIIVDLSAEGIEKAIREVKEYKEWLERKTVELRNRIAEEIAKDANFGFNSSPVEILPREGVQIGTVDVVVEEEGDISVVVANGTDAVWIEFGAGVYYNGSVGASPNPLVSENGLPFTIGSMSASNPYKLGWKFVGEDGETHFTHGTPASMPFYNAVQGVINDIASIAKEVFSNP